MAIAELNKLVRSLNKFNNSSCRKCGAGGKPVIDIETLQIWPSLTACPAQLQTSPSFVGQAILQKNKCKGRLLEYFDDWVVWSNKDKEKHTKKNNIYFY